MSNLGNISVCLPTLAGLMATAYLKFRSSRTPIQIIWANLHFLCLDAITRLQKNQGGKYSYLLIEITIPT